MALRPSNVTSDNHGKSSSRPTQLPDSLICRVKFNNTLPDIPFDPKFLVNPLDIQRYVPYKTTSLEQNAKHELLTSFDLGVDINLILPERYAVHPDNIHDIHDPDDYKLINDDDIGTPGSTSKRNPRDNPHSALHNKIVPWLKKTEYISTEFNRYGASSEKTETKVGYNVRKKMKEDTISLDKESQIVAIDKTFEAARKPIEKHHSKPNVVPVKITPLLPDFEMWKYPFAQVVFDNEPSDLAKEEELAQAIIKGMAVDETQEPYVAYFLPTEITMAERLLDQSNNRDYTEDKAYEYKLTREYNWQVKTTQNDNNFFLAFRDDAVYYNALETRVKLTKRRTKSSRDLTDTTLTVVHRPLNEQELRIQENRLAKLEPPQIGEEMNISGQAESFNESSQDQLQKNMETEQSSMAISTEQRPSTEEDQSSSDSDSSSSANSSSSSSSSDSSSDDDEVNEDEKGKLSKEIFGSDDSDA